MIKLYYKGHKKSSKILAETLNSSMFLSFFQLQF